MKNHAFLITCYKQPNLVARIIHILYSPNHYFFVHVDKKTNITPFVEAVGGLQNVKFTKQINVNHARYSQLVSELDLLHDAKEFEIKKGLKFDYVHMVSGNDYPLRSNEQFDAFFDETDATFMLYDKEEFWNKYKSYAEHTVNDYHLNHGGIWSTIFIKTLGRLLGYVCPRKRIKNLSGGWDWWSWNSDTFNYVLEYLDNHPDYQQRWNHTLCVTEKFFHTMLADKKADLRIDTWNPLRFVSWKPKRDMGPNYDPHRPYNLTEKEYDLVINSKAFFCRKVDEIVSANLLDLIDKQRGNYYNINEHDYFR